MPSYLYCVFLTQFLKSQDFSQQPPAQELIARDLHDNEWKFRHIFRGEFYFTDTNWFCICLIILSYFGLQSVFLFVVDEAGNLIFDFGFYA